MLVCFANPRSATAALIQICNSHRNVLDLSCSTQLISPTAPRSRAATASNIAFYRVPASQTPRPQRSNPHSASRAPAVPSSRFPPLEVFVRRPPCARNRSVAAGIRKPSQEQTYLSRSTQPVAIALAQVNIPLRRASAAIAALS